MRKQHLHHLENNEFYFYYFMTMNFHNKTLRSLKGTSVSMSMIIFWGLPTIFAPYDLNNLESFT